MHRQVPVVAILLIVQGALECVMGIFYAAMGPVMFAMMQASPPPPSSGAPGPTPEQMGGIVTGVYIVMGVVVLAIGVLGVVAGVKNLKYRSRTLGIVALAAGLGTILGCYCFPTALALGIYGLIVYLNQQSQQAFALGAQGMTPDQIKAQVDMGAMGGAPYAPPPAG